MKNHPHTSDLNWLEQADIVVWATLPWNQETGIPGQQNVGALGALSGQTEQRWNEVRLRQAADGSLSVLSGQDLLVLGRDGRIKRRIVLPRPAPLDWLLADNGLILLEKGAPTTHILSRITSEGETVWEKKGDPSWVQLLLHQGQFQLVREESESISLQQFDPETGETADLWPLDARTTPVFAGNPSSGEYCHLSYDPVSNQRIWNRSARGTETQTLPIPADWYGLFAFPLASDRHSDAYGAFGMEAGKVAVDRDLSWKIKAEALVPGSDGTVWASASLEDGVALAHWAPGGVEYLHCPISRELNDTHHNPQWRLIQVKDGKHYLSGRNSRSFQAIDLVWDGSGQAEVIQPDQPLAAFGCWTQAARSWAVSREGDLFIPVATPEALVIVKLKL